MKRNLIFAMTPLHMLISENIIKINPDDRFDIIVLGDGSRTSRYYFDRIKKYVNQGKYVEVNFNESFVRKIIYLIYFSIIFLLKRYRYDTLIFGNVNLKLNHLAFFLFSYKEVNTYDDGLGNLLKEGDYSESDTSSIFNRNKILKSSSLHYTIFDEENTAKCKIEKLKIFNKKRYDGTSKTPINIFLGQPIHELDKQFNQDYVLNLLNKIEIDVYCPHPRENNKLYKLRYSESVLIIEDYIIDLIDSGFEVNVFGFYSTALLNIKTIFPLLRVCYLYDEKIFNHPKLKGVENIFNNFKIERIFVE